VLRVVELGTETEDRIWGRGLDRRLEKSFGEERRQASEREQGTGMGTEDRREWQALGDRHKNGEQVQRTEEG
jgi:hypothetical protein